MKEAWFRSNNQDERNEIKIDFEASSRLLKRMKDILENKLKKPSSDYDIANWAYHQADMNGYNRAIQEVIELIKGD